MKTGEPMNYRTGYWQVVDFRIPSSHTRLAVWDGPPLHVVDAYSGGTWQVLYQSSVLVIATGSYGGDVCFFIHESLLDDLVGEMITARPYR